MRAPAAPIISPKHSPRFGPRHEESLDVLSSRDFEEALLDILSFQQRLAWSFMGTCSLEVGL